MSETYAQSTGDKSVSVYLICHMHGLLSLEHGIHRHTLRVNCWPLPL